MTKSNISKQNQVNDCTTSMPLSEKRKNTDISVIVGCQVPNKKRILRDKLTTCEEDTQNMRSSQMSEVDSTSKERNSFPYWNSYVAEVSKKLWLPIKTAYVDSVSNLSNGLSSITVEKSWFSKNFLYLHKKNLSKIYSRLSISSAFEFTGSANIGKKSRKIRLYPTNKQHSLLRVWNSYICF